MGQWLLILISTQFWWTNFGRDLVMYNNVNGELLLFSAKVNICSNIWLLLEFRIHKYTSNQNSILAMLGLGIIALL